MQIDHPVRRRSRLSLTPLIDVIFLLLLFFMLSSTFSRYSEVSLSGGGGAAKTVSQPDAILSIDVGELKLNGAIAPLESIGDRLGELKQAGAQRLLIIVGSDAVSQDFVALMAEVGKSRMPATVARQPR